MGSGEWPGVEPVAGSAGVLPVVEPLVVPDPEPLASVPEPVRPVAPLAGTLALSPRSDVAPGGSELGVVVEPARSPLLPPVEPVPVACAMAEQAATAMMAARTFLMMSPG